MKKAILFLFIIASVSVSSQEKASSKSYNILLTGASFASPGNGWFELGCKSLGVNAINRAIGGEAIANTANRMINGTLYSKEELENIDAMVIMQVHNKDVIDETQLKENYTDYEVPFKKTNYAAAFDYVIKRYLTECYQLKDDSTSKYFSTKCGKPAVIVLCTHWHDSRETYNKTIRQLAEKWGLPLVEFDKYIGFSKNQKHPVTKEEISLIYAKDTQKSGGEIYGWHPLRGEDSYIQQRMGAIYADLMRRILLF